MWSYLIVFVVQTALLCLVAWWYVRAYRKAAHASRRRVERMVSSAKSAALEAEVEYLRHRQEILLRGLFPRGDVFPGNFIEDDPELHALCELLEVVRGQPLPDSVKKSS
jgi:hypothetical protein